MMNDKFVKPSGFKYYTMPNMWELCKFLAVVLHVSGKPNPWDNRKTFDRCGYMPLYGGKEGFGAVDVVKEIIKKAQSKGKLGVYPEGSSESYEDLAKSFVDRYVFFVKSFKQETKICFGTDRTAIRYFMDCRLKQCALDGTIYCEKFDYLIALACRDVLQWKEWIAVRKGCIDLVVWYLGEQFRSRCEEQYNKQFQGTLFSSEDYAELLKKDVKKWDERDKALAFSVPFCGQNWETRTKLYGDIFELMTRHAERLGNNGSKHTNLWIDQYTELGYSFGWHTERSLNDGVKQVLRNQPMDDSDKKELKSTLNRLMPPKIQVCIQNIVDSWPQPSKSDDFVKMTNRKGIAAVISNLMLKAMKTAPKDAVHQIPDDWHKQLIDIADKMESPSDRDVKNFFNLIADNIGVFGGTGDKVKDYLMQYMPNVREMLNDPSKVEQIGSILYQFAEIAEDLQKNIKKN